MTKETYTAVLARLEERLKNLVETNNTQHKEIISNVKELNNHVNEEIQKMDNRVSKLEHTEITAKAERRTIKIIVASIGGLVALIFSVLGILAYLGVI